MTKLIKSVKLNINAIILAGLLTGTSFAQQKEDETPKVSAELSEKILRIERDQAILANSINSIVAKYTQMMQQDKEYQSLMTSLNTTNSQLKESVQIATKDIDPKKWVFDVNAVNFVKAKTEEKK